MTQRILALGLALAFALAQAAPAAAQARARLLDDWSAVQALSPGQKIVVRTKDGDRLTGRFDSASDLLINFDEGKRKVSLTRESIRLVQLDRGNSRGKGALVGALIGAGAGFAVGSVLYFPFKHDMVGAVVPVSAALGATVGTGVGLATGKGNKNETVYEAPWAGAWGGRKAYKGQALNPGNLTALNDQRQILKKIKLDELKKKGETPPRPGSHEAFGHEQTGFMTTDQKVKVRAKKGGHFKDMDTEGAYYEIKVVTQSRKRKRDIYESSVLDTPGTQGGTTTQTNTPNLTNQTTQTQTLALQPPPVPTQKPKSGLPPNKKQKLNNPKKQKTPQVVTQTPQNLTTPFLYPQINITSNNVLNQPTTPRRRSTRQSKQPERFGDKRDKQGFSL